MRKVAAADVAVLGGAVLLVAGFLPWYGLDAGVFATGGGEGGPSLSAWEASPSWWVPVLSGAVLAGLWLARRLGRLEARWLPAVSVAVGVLGLVLVVAEWTRGVAVLPADFGWYAYSPLTDASGVPSTGPRAGLFVALAALFLQTTAAALHLRRRAEGPRDEPLGYSART